MNIWREYRCDQNHSWTVYADDVAEPAASAHCPVDGSEAVTVSKQPPADRVTIAIVPAARIVDSRTGKIGHEREYFLELSSSDGSQRIRSKVLDWQNAVTMAERFKDLPWEQAMGRWKHGKLSEQS
jgi:hypothetical protein